VYRRLMGDAVMERHNDLKAPSVSASPESRVRVCVQARVLRSGCRGALGPPLIPNADAGDARG